MWGFVQFSKKPAGTKEDVFKLNNDENIKWVLRQIYYKERTYQMQNGKFTDDLSQLDVTIPKEYITKVYTTPNYFEAVIKLEDKKYYISSEGRTWKVKK